MSATATPTRTRTGTGGRSPRSPLMRNGYALMANTAVTAVLGLLYWLLAARLYPAAAVGAGGAAVSALLFVAGVSQLNFMGAIWRFLPIAGPQSRRFLAATYAISTACALVLGTIATAIGGWGPVFVAGAAVWCLFVLQDSALAAVRQAVWVPVENGVFGVAKIALLGVLAAAGVGRHSGSGILASWTLPAAACVIPINWALFRRFIPRHADGRPSHELTARRIGRFVAGDYLGSLCNQALLSLMPLLVVGLKGKSEGGHFFVAWTIASTMDLLASNLATSMTVEGALDEERVAHFGRVILHRLAVVLLPIAVGTAAFSALLLTPFGAGYRHASAPVLRLLALATLPRAIATVAIGLSRVERKVSRIAKIQAAQAVLVLGLAALLVPRLGIVGAGVAAVIGHTAVAAAVLPGLRNRLVGTS